MSDRPTSAMKFIANGPDIPDELLVARDAGKVILFCGAGVSQAKAELPNFAGLARRAIESLGSAQDSRARVLLERRSLSNQCRRRRPRRYRPHFTQWAVLSSLRLSNLRGNTREKASSAGRGIRYW